MKRVKSQKNRTMQTTLNDSFRLIVFINLILCLLTLSGMFVISILDFNQPDLRNDLFSTCSTVFKMGAGAFIGLLGGRASK